MRHDVHLHLDYTEITLLMANAALEAQIKRATDYIADLKSQLAAATAANAGAADAEDTADATELSTALDKLDAPAAPSASVSASVSTAA